MTDEETPKGVSLEGPKSDPPEIPNRSRAELTVMEHPSSQNRHGLWA